MVRVLESGLYGRGFDHHTGHGSLLKLRQFHLALICLEQYTQLQMSTNIVGKVPAMDYRPVQESQYNCALIACKR